MRHISILFIPIVFLTILAGFIFPVVYKNIQTKDIVTTTQRTDASPSASIALQPPSRSLTGTITSAKGSIEKIPWDISGHIPASSGASLYQGDEIITNKNSEAVITISNALTCILKENTHVLLSNLLPEQLLIQHRAGTIQCQNPDTISIRIGTALLQIQHSAVESSVDDKKIHIQLASGSGTLALVDNQNKTDIWNMTDSDKAVIDRNTSTVITSGTLTASY